MTKLDDLKLTETERENFTERCGKYAEVMEPEAAELQALADLLKDREAVQEAKKPAPRKTSWTASEILSHEFPPVQYIVPGLITPGLTILAGAPKLGKSWLALNMAMAVSDGGRFMGKIDVQKCSVLYLCLEDTARRLQDRLQKLNATPVDNLQFILECPSGAVGLASYLREHKDTRLVIIDTWARFSLILDQNDYAETTRKAGALKSIADELDISIVVIHHTRKSLASGITTGDWMDGVLGSQGLAGAADSTIVLKRARGERQAELLATGRDIEEQALVLTFDIDAGGWTIEGNKQEILDGQTQQLIHDWLRDNGASGPKAIHKGLVGQGYTGKLNTVQTVLRRMTEAEKLQSYSGVYIVPPLPSTPSQSFTNFTGFTPKQGVEPMEKPPVEPHIPVKGVKDVKDSTAIPSPSPGAETRE
ncbi:hypothetical protein AGMMS49942_03580 [Spirochaetia bacterium]|nr:hypothetical protein AGMMS49942_03580 [Spirochaetia bacterium]